MQAWGEVQPFGLAAVWLWAMRARLLPWPITKPAFQFMSKRCSRMDVTMNGLKMRCHLGDNSTERKALTKTISHHRALSALIHHVKSGDVFVDVGANCGLFTLHAARSVGPAGRVIAIEPMPEMVDRLRFNVAANGFDNVAIVVKAVGLADCTATLYVNEMRRGTSSLLDGGRGMPVQVPVTTLPRALAELGVQRVDVLKMDIEGWEDRALQPLIEGAELLWPRFILLETSHKDRWQYDCISELAVRGYREKWKGKGDLLFSR